MGQAENYDKASKKVKYVHFSALYKEGHVQLHQHFQFAQDSKPEYDPAVLDIIPREHGL